MKIVDMLTALKAAPFRCPACDVEWQDHPGIGPTCAERGGLYEALEAVLPYCRPPIDKGIDENVEYLRRMARAQKALKEMA
jgi:hypothetical protein